MSKNCSVDGCPLIGTISSGSVVCKYHYNTYGQGRKDITRRIENYLGYISKYYEMVNWSGSEWSSKDKDLKGWKVLPKGEKEPPTVYLARFDKWRDEKIKGL